MIDRFEGEYHFLSNFFGGRDALEQKFQAAKCVDPAEAKEVLACHRPSDAKRMGKKVKLVPNWDNIRVSVMERLLREKFSPGSFLAEALLKTGNEQLLEGNYWGDVFWGVDLKTHKGENNLGKLLMKIRNELRS
jgi:ribA/ribD-fused uncharacterized protein